MPKKKLTQKEKRELRDQLLGFIVIEVVRVANDGLQAINQTDVIDRIKKRHGGKKLSGSTVSTYVNQWLRSNVLGRVWLKSDTGQRLELQSENTILRDSKSISALLIAKRMSDSDGQFLVNSWSDRCRRVSGAAQACKEYLDLFGKCGYVVNGGATRGVAQLDLATINQDMFYLRHAKDAGLRGRPKRSLASPQ